MSPKFKYKDSVCISIAAPKSLQRNALGSVIGILTENLPTYRPFFDNIVYCLELDNGEVIDIEECFLVAVKAV